MNEIECETCIKRKTKYCPNSSECYENIDKPYYQNRIMLLEENKQLKGSLQTYEILLEANVEENQKLKADYGNKAQVERDLLEEENKQLKENNLAMQEEMARTWAKLQQKGNVINKAIEELYIWGETLNPEFQKRMLEILEKSDNNE